MDNFMFGFGVKFFGGGVRNFCNITGKLDGKDLASETEA